MPIVEIGKDQFWPAEMADAQAKEFAADNARAARETADAHTRGESQPLTPEVMDASSRSQPTAKNTDNV